MAKITTPKNAASQKPARQMARSAELETSPATSPVDVAVSPSPSSWPDAATLPTPTKASLVLDLLRREEGATLAELVTATGWQPHTVRAHLTSLRKKGHAIGKSRRDDATCYRVAEAG